MVASPIVEIGEADYIISFEKLEAARYAPYLKKGGRIIVNTQEIDPMPVLRARRQYPSEILGELSEKGVSVDAFDALSLAEKAGSIKAVNIVLMGLFAKYVGIPEEKWISAIEDTVAERFIEMNKKAFDLGYGKK